LQTNFGAGRLAHPSNSSHAHRIVEEKQMDKFPVTTRAVVQRINRKLKPERRRLYACRRNSRWWRDLGDFYVTDIYRNTIVDTRVDPETYGRRLGVLQPFEKVADIDQEVVRTEESKT
jgi:hypothetical protein